jgi:hypothetical protein
MGSSLGRRSPAECGVSECDRDASVMRRPWPTRGCYVMGREKKRRLRNIFSFPAIRFVCYRLT